MGGHNRILNTSILNEYAFFLKNLLPTFSFVAVQLQVKLLEAHISITEQAKRAS